MTRILEENKQLFFLQNFLRPRRVDMSISMMMIHILLAYYEHDDAHKGLEFNTHACHFFTFLQKVQIGMLIIRLVYGNR